MHLWVVLGCVGDIDLNVNPQSVTVGESMKPEVEVCYVDGGALRVNGKDLTFCKAW